MPRKHNNLNSLFQDIANAIQDKNGYDSSQQDGKFLADNFPDAIATIDTDPSGDATATASDILASKTAYAQGQKLTGTIVTKNDSGNTTLNTSTTSKSYAAGYYPNAHGAAITLETKSATPSETAQTITPSSGKVLSSVSVDAIPDTYIGSAVTQKAAATYNVSSSNQTISGGQYLSGTQTIRGVTTSGISAANVKSGATIKVGDSADDDRLVNVPGTFSASSTITGTGKSAASAANILTGKSAFLDGAQLDGTMPNNGSTGTTLTAQGSSYTIPAGYTSGGTVSVNIPTTALTNSIITSVVMNPTTASGDEDTARVTVDVPAGMHSAVTVTKDFADLLPGLDTGAAAAQILDGYQAYDATGKALTGTMSNNGAVSASLNTSTTSYTVPSGYHNGSGRVSITTQTKSATPTESAQTISPDSGKVLSSVSVAAIPNNYVGSAITVNPTMTASGATVTAPAGYYSTAQNKSVSTTTHPNPTVSTSLDTTNHKLTLTATHVQGTGYVTGSTTTGTSTITSVPGATITPSSSSQTAIAASRYTEGAITVAAVPTETKTAYATTSDQTISPSSGKFLSSVAVKKLTNTNLSAANIKAGTTITVNNSSTNVWSVAGTFTSDATAAAGDIASGKTAYVNGSKITGTAVVATGDITVAEYATGKCAGAYLNGRASVATSSGVNTLTSVGSVSTVSGKLVLTLNDAC